MRKLGISNLGLIKKSIVGYFHTKITVEYGGNSIEEVIENYPLYLTEFIKHRLEGRLSPVNEKETLGRGGLKQLKKFYIILDKSTHFCVDYDP